MKSIGSYFAGQGWRLFVVTLAIAAVAFGIADPGTAMAGAFLGEMSKPELEVLQKALGEHGVALKSFMEKQTETLTKHNDKLDELSTRLKDVEQKGSQRGGGGDRSDDPIGELAQLIVGADQTKAYLGGHTPKTQIAIPHRLLKAAIINATGQNQPLVVADRRPGIVHGPQRRFTIRDLFTQVPTSGNLIEFAKETLFTNNAGPQYDTSSPTPYAEGAIKPESGITFELVTATVSTIAHWVPASRQVLADAPMLQRYLNDRLIYGLKLEEESELLDGTGTNGELNGIKNQATLFTGGATNQGAMDTLALSIAQLAAADYMPSGFILNPRDWWSGRLRLAKDAEGRYILGDPAEAGEPRLWGLPCVITNAQTLGEFTTIDAAQAGFIADREGANVRLSEHHSDFFIRNMVAILAEERISLVIERPSAIIDGSLTFAG